METIDRATKIKGLIYLAALLALGIVFRAQVMLAFVLIFGGAVTAFLLSPLAARLEKRLPRAAASFLSLAIVALALLGALWLLLPPIVRQYGELAAHFSPARVKELAERLAERLADFGVSTGDMAIDPAALAPPLGNLFAGAGGAISGGINLVLSIVLGLCFLSDRERIALRLTLLVPAARRDDARRACAGAIRELRGYLRGQAIVCTIVAALTSVALWAIGLRSALALGVLVGLFNIVPYFGPVLGGIPVLLVALPGGLRALLPSLAALIAVQQLDAMVVSPRVMTGITGLPPAAVLLVLSVGGSLAGPGGMLLALPAMLIVRIFYRTWTSRNTTIDKRV